MADLKISQLSSATALAGTEVVPVVQSGTTKKATIDQILSPASGKGIDFSAAGGDVLTMYDEGTWTVTLYDAATGGNASPTTVTGNYTRIGNVVHCWFRDLNDIVTTGMTNPILYISLPIAAPANVQSGGSIVLQNVNYGPDSCVTPQAVSSTQRAWLRITKDNAGANVVTVAGLTSGTSDILSFQMTYRV